MKRRTMVGLLICAMAAMLVTTGCGGVKADEQTKQKIRNSVHPQLRPLSEFRFLNEGGSSVSFEFRAADGQLWGGTFDGKYVSASRKGQQAP